MILLNIWPKSTRWLTLLLTLTLGGCSSHQDSTTGPVVNLPESIVWDENKPVVFSIQASGDGPYTYQLVAASDWAAFNLDSSTGMLTSTTGFDFEQPVDQNLDGVFELSISISDAKQASVVKTLQIQISNVEEHGLEVHFPASESNLAGGVASVRLRGMVTDLDKVIVKPTSILTVMVNGMEAHIAAEDKSHWWIDFPVTEGENTLELDVLVDETPNYSDTLTFYNSFIPDLHTSVIDTSRTITAVALGGRAVLTGVEEGREPQILFTRSDVDAGSDCPLIGEVTPEIIPNRLLFTCTDISGSSRKLFIANLLTKQFLSVGAGPRQTLAENSKKLDSEHILVRRNANQFYVVNSQTFQVYNIDVHDPLSANIEFLNFDVYQNALYLTALGNSGVILYRVELPNSYSGVTTLIELEANQFVELQTDYLEGNNGDFSFYLYNDRMYVKEFLSVATFQLTGEFLGGAPLNVTLIDPPDPLQQLNDSQSIIFAADGIALLKQNNRQDIYELNIDSLQYTQLTKQDPEVNIASYHYSKNRDAIAVFDQDTLRYLEISLPTSDVIKVEQINFEISDTWSSAGWKIIDPDTEKVYFTPVESWYGDAPDETPKIHVYDFGTGVVEDILPGSTISAQIDPNASDSLLRLSAIYPGPDNTLIFGASLILNDESVKTGVYRYSLEDSSLTTLYQSGHSSSSEEGYLTFEPFTPGFYVPGLGGYILSNFIEGSLHILSSDGEIRELIARHTSFEYLQTGVFDELNNRIIIGGNFPRDDQSGNWAPSIIAEYDLTEDSTSVIGNNPSADGRSTTGGYFTFDDKRQLIYQIHRNYIVSMDLKSHQSVFKTISNWSSN